VLRVLRDFHQISDVRIMMIVIGAWLLIRLETHLGKWLSRRLGGKFRMLILPSVPVLRLVILIVALVLIVPLVIEPTRENLVAILGASALGLAFALKDYVGSVVSDLTVRGKAALLAMGVTLGWRSTSVDNAPPG
jgi:hypothetical protein